MVLHTLIHRELANEQKIIALIQKSLARLTGFDESFPEGFFEPHYADDHPDCRERHQGLLERRHAGLVGIFYQVGWNDVGRPSGLDKEIKGRWMKMKNYTINDD